MKYWKDMGFESFISYYALEGTRVIQITTHIDSRDVYLDMMFLDYPFELYLGMEEITEEEFLEKFKETCTSIINELQS